ncbi:murein L,D-transpeptidase [Rhizobium sp. SSA_523]|uniref:L,D-transpeptidase family protein n=1 Tax=Rhizobium sp. SSA_523 TaxID=2952477 RepID=UPI002091DBEA|nr:L,D-transpeptidase family protein [Rhizobium sp. SSA_523]MCO5730013.1 L,D-transpeptidase family protein [Rhizobium sp. SSA_523]WKC25915.1 L,D-transpeptidase family protein [Rhizobium sp. SSA_523]
MPAAPLSAKEQRAIDMSDPEPLPKVTGPKYYTYKTDAMRSVKTAGFAEAVQDADARFLTDAKVQAPSDIAAALETYYAKGGKLLWVEKGDVNDRARLVIAAMQKAREYGLDPADYRLAVPALTTASVQPTSSQTASSETASIQPASVDATGAPEQTPAAPVEMASAGLRPAAGEAGASSDQFGKDLMQFELALSAKVAMFAQDMIRGRIDPNKISGYHDLERRSVNLDTVLPFAGRAPDAGAYLLSLAPQSPQFTALKDELHRLLGETGTAEASVSLPDNLLLKPGETNEALAKVMTVIERRASDQFKTEHAAVLAAYQDTPVYAPELVELVKGFQKEVGLKPDGVVGPATVRAMTGHTNESKIAKLVVAMEEARWLPDDLGSRFVFINQPAYQAYYHENGQEQFSMRVVVGSPSHQTYFFRDQIETVEVNPYWGVPQSIIINEMLPKLRQDASYLDRLGYQVEVKGKAVSSTAVNWYGSTQAISVRQPPSSDNALGELKILFPNSHAIYMHDTPQKAFFKRDMRALSHGCVRLAEPRKMAAAVLGISEAEVGQKIAQGKNAALPVTAKIPVYVAYFTAWPNKDGKVEFFDDVYGRDTAMEKAFSAVSKSRGV